MRPIPHPLAAALVAETTTLCRCWRLTRGDGLVLGFTDHDRPLAFDGTAFEAASGAEAGESVSALGFAESRSQAAGALASDAIEEGDLAAGLYDGARVETWLVDWSDPARRMLLETATVSRTTRADGAWRAELAGPLAALAAERGRVYGATCDAAFGDARCGVDAAAYTAAATVAGTDGGLAIETAGLGAFGPGWFTGGRVRFLGGANAGQVLAVEKHRADGALDLAERAPRPIAAGDAIAVTAGCDKRVETCRAKFGNVLNFRGFPHLPGNDFIVRVPQGGEPGLDGGSLFR